MYTSLKTLVLLAYLLWSHFFNNTKFKESYIFVSGCIGVCSHFFSNTKFKECYIFISCKLYRCLFYPCHSQGNSVFRLSNSPVGF